MLAKLGLPSKILHFFGLPLSSGGPISLASPKSIKNAMPLPEEVRAMAML
jgi:hypothetical protein